MNHKTSHILSKRQRQNENDDDVSTKPFKWHETHVSFSKMQAGRQAFEWTDGHSFIHTCIHTCIRSLVQLKWTDGHLNSHTCMYYDATTMAKAVAVATRTSTTTTMRTSEVVRIVVAVMFVGDISLNIRQKAVSSTHTHIHPYTRTHSKRTDCVVQLTHGSMCSSVLVCKWVVWFC